MASGVWVVMSTFSERGLQIPSCLMLVVAAFCSHLSQVVATSLGLRSGLGERLLHVTAAARSARLSLNGCFGCRLMNRRSSSEGHLVRCL